MAMLPKDVMMRIATEGYYARRVLCIGGPMNGQVCTHYGDHFQIPSRNPRPDRFDYTRYHVERFSNGDGTMIFFARAEDVPIESVFTLLLEAYAAWHTHASRLLGEGIDAWAHLGVGVANDPSDTVRAGSTADIAAFRESLMAKRCIDGPPVPAPDPDAPCDDCKGTRQYLPFTGPAIPCPTCRPAAPAPAPA
jgi:hypothetical protein